MIEQTETMKSKSAMTAAAEAALRGDPAAVKLTELALRLLAKQPERKEI